MKALMIEDDQNIVEIVSLGFKMRCPEVDIVAANNGEAGIRMAKTEDPDIIILDLGLPDISGFEVLACIRRFTKIPVLVLSVRTDEKDISKGLELGAEDYVLKPFKQTELIGRVRALLSTRGRATQESWIECGPVKCLPHRRQLLFKDSPLSVTATEFDIIRHLMENAGRGVSSKELCEVVWSDGNKALEDSLKLHIKRLRRRVEEDPENPKMLVFKAGTGYYLSRPTREVSRKYPSGQAVV